MRRFPKPDEAGSNPVGPTKLFRREPGAHTGLLTLLRRFESSRLSQFVRKRPSVFQWQERRLMSG